MIENEFSGARFRNDVAPLISPVPSDVKKIKNKFGYIKYSFYLCLIN